MKLHRGTVEVLISLYELSSQTRLQNQGLGEPTYNIYPDEHESQFCCVFDNLDRNVQMELIALFWLGMTEGATRADFVTLVEDAKTDAGDADPGYLFGKVQLTQGWRVGMDLMGLSSIHSWPPSGSSS